MQVSVLKHEGLTHEIEITVPAADVAKRTDEILLERGKSMKVDGFRKGKVPMTLLKQRYGKSILGDVLEKTVQESASSVLKDKNLRPALQPQIKLKDETNFDEGKDLTFTMKVEVLPEFKVTDFAAIAVDKPIAAVEEKAIDEMMEKIAKGRRNFNKVDGRAAAKGDLVVVDFNGTTKEGEAFPGMSGTDMQVELGSGQLIPGFEDQLIGKNAGDHVHVDVTFPADYGMKDLAGKPAIFHVDIKEIREPAAAKIDDDFAKEFGLENLQQMRDKVREEIAGDYDNLARMKLKRNLLDALDGKHSFDLPVSMVEMEYNAIEQQLQKEKQQQGEKAEFSADEKTELRQIAERRVRLGLVLAEVGRVNNITVSQAELNQAIMGEMRKFPGQEQRVLEFYSKNPQVIESFRPQILEDKVIDFILKQAKVTEVNVTLDELTQEDDELPKAGKKTEKKAASKKK